MTPLKPTSLIDDKSEGLRLSPRVQDHDERIRSLESCQAKCLVLWTLNTQIMDLQGYDGPDVEERRKRLELQRQDILDGLARQDDAPAAPSASSAPGKAGASHLACLSSSSGERHLARPASHPTSSNPSVLAGPSRHVVPATPAPASPQSTLSAELPAEEEPAAPAGSDSVSPELGSDTRETPDQSPPLQSIAVRKGKRSNTDVDYSAAFAIPPELLDANIESPAKKRRTPTKRSDNNDAIVPPLTDDDREHLARFLARNDDAMLGHRNGINWKAFAALYPTRDNVGWRKSYQQHKSNEVKVWSRVRELQCAKARKAKARLSKPSAPSTET